MYLILQQGSVWVKSLKNSLRNTKLESSKQPHLYVQFTSGQRWRRTQGVSCNWTEGGLHCCLLETGIQAGLGVSCLACGSGASGKSSHGLSGWLLKLAVVCRELPGDRFKCKLRKRICQPVWGISDPHDRRSHHRFQMSVCSICWTLISMELLWSI